MPIAPCISVPLAEIEHQTSRWSARGQHANVTASQVETVFDMVASKTLGAEQRARTLERLVNPSPCWRW
jgi:protein subunit release factor B